jgi:hypothetical protein
MSRSGYNEDMDDQWQLIRWRGAVESAMNGKRGQAFLREMLAAIDSLPVAKLVAKDLQYYDGATDTVLACALGAVGLKRGVDMTRFDPEDTETVAGKLGIADAMAREIVYMNDEWFDWKEKPEHRFYRMRRWIVASIRGPVISEDESGRWADDGGSAK